MKLTTKLLKKLVKEAMNESKNPLRQTPEDEAVYQNQLKKARKRDADPEKKAARQKKLDDFFSLGKKEGLTEEQMEKEIEESRSSRRKFKHDELEYELGDEDRGYSRPSSSMANLKSTTSPEEKPSFLSTWLQADVPMGYKDSEGRDLQQAKSYHKSQIYKIGPDAAFDEIDAMAKAAEKAQDAVARKFVSRIKDDMLDMYG